MDAVGSAVLLIKMRLIYILIITCYLAAISATTKIHDDNPDWSTVSDLACDSTLWMTDPVTNQIYQCIPTKFYCNIIESLGNDIIRPDNIEVENLILKSCFDSIISSKIIDLDTSYGCDFDKLGTFVYVYDKYGLIDIIRKLKCKIDSVSNGPDMDSKYIYTNREECAVIRVTSHLMGESSNRYPIDYHTFNRFYANDVANTVDLFEKRVNQIDMNIFNYTMYIYSYMHNPYPCGVNFRNVVELELLSDSLTNQDDAILKQFENIYNIWNNLYGKFSSN